MKKCRQLVLWPEFDSRARLDASGVIWPNVSYRSDKARFRWLQRLWKGGYYVKAS